MFPVGKFQDLLNGKEEMVGVIEVLGNRSEMPMSIKELSGKKVNYCVSEEPDNLDSHFRNQNIVLDKETIRISPWCHDNSLAMAFFDTYDLDTNQPWPFNPRLLAKTKIMVYSFSHSDALYFVA